MIIRPDGSYVEKDYPPSINTGRTMIRTIGVSCVVCCGSRVLYWTRFLDGFPRKEDEKYMLFSWIVRLLPAFIHCDRSSVLTSYPR